MLSHLKSMFREAVSEATSTDQAHADHGLQVAVAALLVETIRADHEMDDSEIAAVRSALGRVFSLSAEEIHAVLAAGEAQAHDATSLYEFTSIINQEFSHPDKVQLMEMLWQVAYADGALDKHEAHLMRRLAGLLHIRHREYITAKLKAEPAKR